MTLSRRHHNVFVYYRGPSAKAMTERDAHRQIEDNATKALINTLEHSGPDLTLSFVATFVPSAAAGWPASNPAGFHLQGGPDGGEPAVKRGPRILLGISIEGSTDPSAVPAAPDAGTRIDAAILPPHGGLIAIETKVVDLLDPHQLTRHSCYWKIELSDVVLIRWMAIWEWARAARESTKDAVTSFLLGQFCEYLEILGFGRWADFREEDFAQFAAWSADHQPVLRARMRSAWERVFDLMPAADAARLGTAEAGTLPRTATHAWAQTNRGQAGTNLTLELGKDELQLNLLGWTGNQAVRLQEWLLAHPERARDLGPVVFERRAKADYKGAAFWMHAAEHEVKRFTPPEVQAGEFAQWLNSWRPSTGNPSWTRLAYHLRHTWTRTEVLARGGGVAKDIADLASQAVPLLIDINGWH